MCFDGEFETQEGKPQGDRWKGGEMMVVGAKNIQPQRDTTTLGSYVSVCKLLSK